MNELEGAECPQWHSPCKGMLYGIVEDYHSRNHLGNEFVAPNILVYRCDRCGDGLIPAASSAEIEKWRIQGQIKQIANNKKNTGWKIGEIIGDI